MTTTSRRALPINRPTVAEVDLSAIVHNLRRVRRLVGSTVRIMAVVKANAYGHGAVPVARAVEKEHADWFGVAIPEEGVELRRAGVRAPIHVFTLPHPSQISLFAEYDLEPTVGSPEEVALLNSWGKTHRATFNVHLKIDTGMNRIGVRGEDIPAVIRKLARSPKVRVRGVFTHFATADEEDKTFAHVQLDRFESALHLLSRGGLSPEVIHCANSAAIMEMPEARYSMVRPGIMMYGYRPWNGDRGSVPLIPAMSLKTKVAHVKLIKRGESVSYGRRFIARRPSKIATLPLGYADGISRRLTGIGMAIIGGRKVPFAGTVCMDQLMVDVTGSAVDRGHEAVLIGGQQGERITAWDVASAIQTIPYEVCCNVSARVPRIYTGQ